MNQMTAPSQKGRLRLGEILIHQGWINWPDLENALQFQKQGDKVPLGEILIGRGFISSNLVYHALAIQFGKRFIELSHLSVPMEVKKIVPKAFLLEHRMVPLEIKNLILQVTVCDPLDVWPLSQLESMMNTEDSEIVLATPEDILSAINRSYLIV